MQTAAAATCPSNRCDSPLLSRLPRPANRAENHRLALAIRAARVDAWVAVLTSDALWSPAVVEASSPPSGIDLSAWVVACDDLVGSPRWSGARERAVAKAAVDLAGRLASGGVDKDDASLRRCLRDMRLWGDRRVAAAAVALDEAVSAMERANLLYVCHVVRRTPVAAHGRSLSFSDRVAEGCVGLRTAVLRFDPDRGLAFTTMATHWIRHAVRRAIDDQGPEIRIAVHQRESMGKVERALNRMRLDGVGHPSTADLAAATKLSLSTVEKCLADLASVGAPTLSLQHPQNAPEGGLGRDFIDTVADDEASVEEQMISADHDAKRSAALRSAMSSLDERSRDIIHFRFGFDGSERDATLKEIGQVYGLTHERVRQLQNEALASLRGHMAAQAAAW